MIVCVYCLDRNTNLTMGHSYRYSPAGSLSLGCFASSNHKLTLVTITCSSLKKLSQFLRYLYHFSLRKGILILHYFHLILGNDFCLILILITEARLILKSNHKWLFKHRARLRAFNLSSGYIFVYIGRYITYIQCNNSQL